MSTDEKTRVRVPDRVLTQKLDDETVLLDLESERYFTLDDVGSRMWHALAETGSVEDACEVLLAEYDVESSRLESDLRTLVSQLRWEGLVEIRHEQAR